MTESGWLRTEKSFNMLRSLGFSFSPRKLRLFARAVACEEWKLDSQHAECRAYLLQLMEHFADGEPLPAGFRLVRSARITDPLHPGNPLQNEAWEAALWAGTPCSYLQTTLELRAHLLRDIFGNPFRPVAFDPNWRTSTVVSIAQGLYDTRDFSAMPILADALEDAGCDHADILDHCRGTGPHVRGCWVVDLVLGKT